MRHLSFARTILNVVLSGHRLTYTIEFIFSKVFEGAEQEYHVTEGLRGWSRVDLFCSFMLVSFQNRSKIVSREFLTLINTNMTTPSVSKVPGT